MADTADGSSLLASFQRDLNRAHDSDRSTRKRGLQKLLEDLPWGKKSQREALKVFVSEHLLKTLYPAIADDVEKCRELSLQILKKCLDKCDNLSLCALHELVRYLCARICDVPFAEPAEEIRLLVVELLIQIKKHPAIASSAARSEVAVASEFEQVVGSIDEKVVQTLVKALADGFPSVKRAGAELLIDVGTTSPAVVKSYFKQLLKSLATNAGHQHSKTRSITMQAIGKGLICLGVEEYENLLKDPILAILLRTVTDRTPSVRIELGNICATVFTHRVRQCCARDCALLSLDFELFVVLLLLHGDAIEEVAAEGKRQLIRAVHDWDLAIKQAEETEVDVPIHHSGMDVDDGEQALNEVAPGLDATTVAVDAVSPTIDYDSVTKLTEFVSANLPNLMRILHEGVESWTTDSRRRYLCALNALITYTDTRITTILPRVLSLLAPCVRDEEGDVRTAAEKCCVRLGVQAVSDEVLEILLPKVAGAVPGGDTATQRANAVGVLTHVLAGLRRRHSHTDTPAGAEDKTMLYLCTTVASALNDTSLYAYREASLREALLLLVRLFGESYPDECKASEHIQQALLLALLFLCGKCPGEDDVISDVAHRELRRLSAICTSSDTPAALLRKHYVYLYYHVVTFQLPSTVLLAEKIDVADPKNLPRLATYFETLPVAWESDSAAMAAFAVLVREAPAAAWEHHALLLPVVQRMVQSKQAPPPGSAEANMQSYAAQRGEDTPNTHLGLVDARLHLLALVEGMVRAGSADWECSRHIAAASAVIIRHLIVPNLVWRVGRVEATVRKVALALCYGLLKAGAVQSETLFSTAAELVPLIVSHLDDSEVTPRQMACLCVTVLFERLRGAFSEQSIHEIYPKLVARLDDSNDQVRVAICGALVMFFQCAAHPRCFSSTTVDYTLDQLFIHLDDPDPTIQQAVLKAVVQAGITLDREAVLRKAEKNRTCHRTPGMCDRVVFEVTGMEILDS